MIRFAKSTLKYLLFFIFGAVVAAIVGATAISYYAVDQLAKATLPEPPPAKKKKKEKVVSEEPELPVGKTEEINRNVKEVVKISLSYEQELALVDQLVSEVQQRKVPEICTTLCNPSYLDLEQLKEKRSEYLVTYYEQQGRRALEDPMFLLKLEEMGFLSRLFPPSMRDLLRQIDQLKQHPDNEKQKWILATKGQVAVYREIANFYSIKDSLLQDEKRIKHLRDLIKQCHDGGNPKKIITECQEPLTN